MSGEEPIQIEEIEQLLQGNRVLKEWRCLFMENQALLRGIKTMIETIGQGNSVPERQNVLRAFSYLPPKRVKVVIVGHEPIGDRPELATGLAFSFPPEVIIDKNVGDPRRNTIWGPGQSVPTVHDALCEAGILEQGGTYDCCHEVWATRGVLLLNAALTLTGGFPDFIPEFVPHILLQVARRSQASRLFVACWGTNAQVVGTRFSTMLEFDGIPRQVITYERIQETRVGPQDATWVIYIGHNPTYPRGNNNFYLEQAAQQFREINEVYPGLFALENLAVAVARGPDDQGH
jgi:uracil DNA glycosylase